jgi:trehalose/maltose hydrolase-like predicted phosphorylase
VTECTTSARTPTAYTTGRPPSSAANPLSGRWEPDLSHNQRHVNAAIFYNVWHYFQATEDTAFLLDYGAEMIAGARPVLGVDRPFRPRPGAL